MIPKIIHFCWLSKEPYPEKVQKCINSWKRYLPEYEIWQWDTDRFDIQSVPWVLKAVEAERYAFAADYIRFYALYHYGGIYMDSDVEVLKSFDGLLDQNFFFGFEYSGDPEAAVVGAAKHLKWIRQCMEWYENHEFTECITSRKQIVAPTILRYGFEKTYQVRLIDREKIWHIRSGTVLPYLYFSPKNEFTREIYTADETYAIHHFMTGWAQISSARIRIKRILHIILIRCAGRRNYNQWMYYLRKILHRT